MFLLFLFTSVFAVCCALLLFLVFEVFLVFFFKEKKK